MKKSIYLLMLCICSLSILTGCSDDDDNAIRFAYDPNQQSLTLQRLEVTSSTFTFEVEATDAEIPYLCLYVDRKVIDRLSRNQLAAYLMDDLKRTAEEEGIPFEEYLASISFKGSQTLKIENLPCGSLYEVVAFAYCGAKAADRAECLYFQTRYADPVDCTFRMDITEQASDHVRFTIVPSDNNVSYYFCTLLKNYYEYYLQSYTRESLFMALFSEDYIARLKEKADPWGYVTQQDIDEVIDEIFFEGPVSLMVSGVPPSTELVWMAAGFAVVTTDEGQQMVLITDVTAGEYGTTAADEATTRWSTTGHKLVPWEHKPLSVSHPVTKRVAAHR